MKKQPPKPVAKGLNTTIPNANPQTQLNSLAGQIQGLATRLEALRAEGLGASNEFKQLEQLLGSVQDKVLLAQAKISK